MNTAKVFDEDYIKGVFSVNLRVILREKKLTQEAFAAKIGTSRSQVAKWTTGANNPEWKTLGRICTALQVEPDWLMKNHFAS